MADHSSLEESAAREAKLAHVRHNTQSETVRIS